MLTQSRVLLACLRLQVRMAYRKRGWALTNTDHISQCKHDAYLQSISEQRGEGCKMWGVLEVRARGIGRGAAGRDGEDQGAVHLSPSLRWQADRRTPPDL